VIDNAKTVGLIALPGAMTGLIMAGASPLEAIQLQIVVKNMVVAATTVSSIVSSYLCWAAFFTKAFQQSSLKTKSSLTSQCEAWPGTDGRAYTSM
jgi:putative ABC transport system permease protein